MYSRRDPGSGSSIVVSILVFFKESEHLDSFNQPALIINFLITRSGRGWGGGEILKNNPEGYLKRKNLFDLIYLCLI